MTTYCIFCGRLLLIPYKGKRPDLKNLPEGVGYNQSRITRHYNFFHNYCFKGFTEVTNNVRINDR